MQRFPGRLKEILHSALHGASVLIFFARNRFMKLAANMIHIRESGKRACVASLSIDGIDTERKSVDFYMDTIV